MGRKSKIEKYGLENKVIELKEKKDKSYGEIASIIQDEYSDVPELKKISTMSISRYMQKKNQGEIEEILDNEDNPGSVILQEFKGKMRELLADAETLKKRNEDLLEDAIDDDKSINEVTKLIKTQNRNLDQIRKNIVTLMEYSDRRFRKPIDNIQVNQQINVKNTILDFTKHLCPECKEKVHNKVIEEIE